jgi:hypothetical protein
MSFRFVGSNSLARKRTSGSSLNDDDTTFVNEYWEENTTSAYGDLTNNPRLNAGQISIIESSEEDILNYLFEVGEDYEEGPFIEFMADLLEDGGKWEAVSETYTEYAILCTDIWDHSTGGDGYDSKKFLGAEF